MQEVLNAALGPILFLLRQVDAVLSAGSIENARDAIGETEERRALVAAFGSADQSTNSAA
jgi:hypothetical protein